MISASSFFAFLLFIFMISTALGSIDEDPMIREVVQSDGGHHDILLYAEHEFTTFKVEYNKTYASQEEDDYRFGVFMSNIRQARRNQILDPSAVHGVTKFSDLTPLEFRDKFLSLNEEFDVPKDIKLAPLLPTNNLPKSWDWRDYGAVNKVKNQGSCGSCWAFSVAATLEGSHNLATGELLSLSEQQMVDCDKTNNGCKGGNRMRAFTYVANTGGLMKENDYPYTRTDTGPCKFNKNKVVASVASFHSISLDEDQYAANLVKYGPLAVGIDSNAALMQTYKGGVSCPANCWPSTNHGVNLVGYGSDRHWIIRNSWGANWGEKGYFLLCKGRIACNSNTRAIAATAVKTSTTS